MAIDPEQIPLSGIIFGIFLLFLGSLFDIPIVYNLGFLIFILSIIIVFIQWLMSGGAIELLNWIPIIIIFSIILTLSSDLVSQSSSTQTFTWPLVVIVLVIILAFMFVQGSDFSFIMPFLPVLLGLGILGYVGGEILWNDPIRGLAYSIGALGIIIMVIWLKVRKSQQKFPITGEKTSIIGMRGKTISSISPTHEGRVKISGAIWKAHADVKIDENEAVKVVGIAEDQLIVKVERIR
jgi:membrane protein implicated in regulation of membrane protease activity